MRFYINFFQPSIKLREKHRKSSKTNRTYHPARTPFQRLRDSGVIETKTLEKLNYVNHTLDPVRLLKQIEALQDALWQHAVLITHPSESPDSEDNHNLRFNVKTCSLSGKPAKADVNPVINAEVRNKRKYRRTKKPKIPRYWRTRKDPYENIRDEIYKWLENNPKRTAKLLLLELQESYPGQYKDNQLRTLQRRVQSWRAKAIITFDDEWLHKEVMTKKELSQLRAVMTETNTPTEIDSNITIRATSSE